MNARQEFLNLFNVLATPTQVYRDLSQFPRWRMPLMFLALSSLILGALMIPAVIEPMKKIFVSSFGENAAEAAVRGAIKPIAIGHLLVEPVFKLMRWLIMAVSLYAMSRVYTGNHSFHFKNILCVIAYTESIFVFMNVLTMLIVYLKGIETIESAADLSIFRGLDYFLRDATANPVLTTLLSNVNPFSVWYVISVGFGLAVLTGLYRAEAIFIAGTGWLIWILSSIGQPQVAGFVVSWLT